MKNPKKLHTSAEDNNLKSGFHIFKKIFKFFWKILDKSLSSPSGKTGKNQSNENPNNLNINYDSENKNSEIQDSDKKNARKNPDSTSQRDRKYSNPNAINSRIFPGEIQLEDLQDDMKKADINQQEWENYQNNMEKKNRNLEDKIPNSHRIRDPESKNY